MKTDLFIKDSNQLITAPTNISEFGTLQQIQNGGVCCYKGKIVAVDTTENLENSVQLTPNALIIDASQKSLLLAL